MSGRVWSSRTRSGPWPQRSSGGTRCSRLSVGEGARRCRPSWLLMLVLEADLYKDWESAVDEAREDLAKFAASYPGPDPDAPGRLADNLQDHLDKAVRIALFDKYMPNATEPGVPIKVKVRVQSKKWRRHGMIAEWVRSPYLHLEITMICPNGGWIGTALWKRYNHFQLGKVTEYRASYQVPAEPKDHGQILFVFNGAESLPSQTSLRQFCSLCCNGRMKLARAGGQCAVGTFRQATGLSSKTCHPATT